MLYINNYGFLHFVRIKYIFLRKQKSKVYISKKLGSQHSKTLFRLRPLMILRSPKHFKAGKLFLNYLQNKISFKYNYSRVINIGNNAYGAINFNTFNMFLYKLSVKKPLFIPHSSLVCVELAFTLNV